MLRNLLAMARQNRFQWMFLPTVLLFGLVVLFSLRYLSDPDLGFHLNAGQWIIDHQSVPKTDISTYSVTSHQYIDIHWLFQVMIYGIYTLFGYSGLSILVSILILILFLLLFHRLRVAKVSQTLTLSLLLMTLLIMEPRFFLRPELFTDIFLVLMLILLDLYEKNKRNLLWLIPVIALVWCNVQGLFMLGFALTGSYFLGSWISDKKPDLKLLGWGILAVLICLGNPYGIRGFFFPFELLTRFGEGNVFHDHIKEFQTLFSLRQWTVREYLFLIYFILTFSAMVMTRKQRKPAEWFLAILFGGLALLAIRNIPLFLIVTLSSTGAALNDISRNWPSRISIRFRFSLRNAGVILLTTIMLMLIPRLLTNAWYPSHLSYNRTGIGLDGYRQPEAAAQFINDNQLDGKVMNSLSFGGWLSWRIPQPIFIDARLEVIDEELYEEVVSSWAGTLPALINKYRPDLIVYDYNRYHTWTPQLKSLANWRPLYLDGLAVIWINSDYKKTADASGLLPSSILHLPRQFDMGYTTEEKTAILEIPFKSKAALWLQGFYSPVNYTALEYRNMASFLLQIGETKLAEAAFLESLNISNGSIPDIHLALAGIYQQNDEPELAMICYRSIQQFYPEVGEAMENQAIQHFNTGNMRYKAGDITGAVEAYSLAIRFNPNYTKAYNNRGLIKASVWHDYSSAMKDFDSAIAIDPEYSDAWLGRGSARYALQDEAGAKRDWQVAASLGNNQAQALVRKLANE